MKEFLSIREVAAYLGVDYKTIYRLIQLGEIPAPRRRLTASGGRSFWAYAMRPLRERAALSLGSGRAPGPGVHHRCIGDKASQETSGSLILFAVVKFSSRRDIEEVDARAPTQ